MLGLTCRSGPAAAAAAAGGCGLGAEPSHGRGAALRARAAPSARGRAPARPVQCMAEGAPSASGPPAPTYSLSTPVAPPDAAGGAGSEGAGSEVLRKWASVKEAGADADVDYLVELGKASSNLTNVVVGAREGMVDAKFVGKFLGVKSDIASGQLRNQEIRSFENLVGDYYVAPKFMDAVTMHVAKNFLADAIGGKTPLILGIWGGKGCGKSFQTELVCKKLKLKPIIMSAGELENVVAGKPGKLIRERYRAASELSRVHGRMSALIINDIDAGVGRFAHTQQTVNTQNVMGTLMNLADNPTVVSIGQDWGYSSEPIRRVPIILTGNDLSTVYAPLIRDGRMSKFYWEPERSDIVQIVHHMFREDNFSRQEIEALVDAFPGQALDFFGALRSRTYDESVLRWAEEIGHGNLGGKLIRRGEPRLTFPAPEPTMAILYEEGRKLAAESELVRQHKLSEEYMRVMKPVGAGISIGLKG